MKCSIVIPAKDLTLELDHTLNRVSKLKNLIFECFVIVDNPTDLSIPTINKFAKKDKRFKLLLNSEPGAAEAIKAGIQKSKYDAIVVTMGDGSDDVNCIPDLVRLIDRGVAIACASRYMPGGQQIGNKKLKGLLSKVAGKSFKFLTNVGTNDVTNSFKAYSKKFIIENKLESNRGFELGIEMISKAVRRGELVAEIPTIWLEKPGTVSNFQLRKWLPIYLRWYLYGVFGKLKSTISAT